MTVGTGTKRTRESSDVTVHGQPSSKRLCRFSPEVQQAIYSDQVALLHIAVLVQPVWLVPLHHRSCLLHHTPMHCDPKDHVAVCKG